MQAESAQQSLEDILTREVQCTECLLVCLEAERSALTQRDLQALEMTIQTPMVCVVVSTIFPGLMR